MTSEIFDCVIIGAGPAGIISAIQLKRAGFNIIIIEKNKICGLLKNANKIENYLGFPGSVKGKDLIALFYKQLLTFNIRPIKSEVLKIQNNDNNIFEIYTENNRYNARTVIVATGTNHVLAGIPGEKKLLRQKVFYEIAELPLKLSSVKYTKNIIIIGGGDAAFDYAINLHRIGHNPLIIIRNLASCLNLLLKTAQENNIPYYEKTQPLCLYEENDKVCVRCRLNYKHKTFKADFVLIAAGRKPAHPQLKLKNKKLRNTDGLFFAGDVKNGRYRQVHIATGDAMQTAMNVMEYLQNDNNKTARK